MRWREPVEGQSRFRSGFLLFPKTLGGETRWLEWAKWREAWFRSIKGADGWFAREWVDE